MMIQKEGEATEEEGDLAGSRDISKKDEEAADLEIDKINQNQQQYDVMGLKRDKSGASGHLTPNLATATAHFVDKNFAFTDVSFN